MPCDDEVNEDTIKKGREDIKVYMIILKNDQERDLRKECHDG